jgi:hypothetical protein
MGVRRSHRRAAFWLTVAGVSILSQIGFNMAADKLPQLRGLRDLNDYTTRRP